MHGLAMALVALVSGSTLVVSAPATPAAPVPEVLAGPEPAVVRACGPEPTTAVGWQTLFGELAGDWAGGDGTSSTRLPDGRMMWLFGDTFVGDVGTDGRRSPGTRIVRNSILVTDGTCASSVSPRTDALPSRPGSWLWPTHSVVTTTPRPGGTTELVVMAQRVERTGPGAFGFRRTGVSVVDLSVPWRGTPVVGRVTDLPEGGVLWGAAIATDGTLTWVYGTRESRDRSVLGRELLLARAPTATLSDTTTWRYRTRSGWSALASKAVPVRDAVDGVSTVLSATVVAHRLVLVTKPQEFLDDRVVALSSMRAWGPWRTTVLLRSASPADTPRYSPTLVAGSRPGSAIVAVNRTCTSVERLMSDDELARPTFHDVDLAG